MTTSDISTLIRSGATLPGFLNLEFGGDVQRKICCHSVKLAAPPEKVTAVLLKAGVAGSELEHVYAACNGAKYFFSASDHSESGEYFVPPIAILAIDSILKRTKELREELEQVPADERPAYAGGVAFAEAPGTGNVFVLMPSGEFEGQVFYCDHDPDENDWPNRPFAKSVEEFLRKILVHPYSAVADVSGADRAWV